jgi:competence protein ComEC
MVLIALGFVAGAWLLQQQSSLPSIPNLLQLWCVAVLLAIATQLLRQRFHQTFLIKQLSLAPMLSALMSVLFASAIGFTWAATIASHRLSDALPSEWEQKNITVVGVIASLPEQTERGQRFLFDVEQVLTPDAHVPSHISLNIYQPYTSTQSTTAIQPPQVRVGERWQWTVRLKRPHGTINPHGFDFEGWALAENIRAMGAVRLKSDAKRLSDRVHHPTYWVDYMRASIASRIDRILIAQPYAGVIRALVIGEDSQISQTDWDVYLRTGTNHLMSISGLHITMLSGLVFAVAFWVWRRIPILLMRLPAKKAAAIGGMLTAIVYAAMAGFSIPTQRTLYMLMTVTVMLLLNRPIAIARMLAVALLVVVLLDPWAVNAAGFWLSFGAVAVIAYATGARIGQLHWFTAAVKAQWAVTLGLLPFLVMMFGQFSLISPLANAFAIPVISFAVVPLAILGSLLPIDIALSLSHGVLSITMLVLDWLAALPFATWQQSAPSVAALLLAILGVAWMLLPNGVPLRWLGVVCLLPLFIGRLDPIAQGEARVTVLDVGQGLSVVVQTAHHTLLYDTGARFNTQSDAGSRIVVPFLRAEGIHQLSGAVLSHDDLDHTGGMASVARLLPIGWLLSSLDADAQLFQLPPFNTWSKQKSVQCLAGQRWEWDAVQFDVLYPSKDRLQDDFLKDNDKSCVIKMTTQYGALLLSGDIERSSEWQLLESQADDLASDILIAPHHGSKTSSTQGFIEAVSPKHVVMTNGYLNRFGHPKPVVQQRYSDAGANVYRSDYDGAVQFVFQAEKPLEPIAWRKANPKYWHDRYL